MHPSVNSRLDDDGDGKRDFEQTGNQDCWLVNDKRIGRPRIGRAEGQNPTGDLHTVQISFDEYNLKLRREFQTRLEVRGLWHDVGAFEGDDVSSSHIWSCLASRAGTATYH